MSVAVVATRRDSSAVVRRVQSSRREQEVRVEAIVFPVPTVLLFAVRESLDPSWDLRVVTTPESAEFHHPNKKLASFR